MQIESYQASIGFSAFGREARERVRAPGFILKVHGPDSPGRRTAPSIDIGSGTKILSTFRNAACGAVETAR